MPAESVDAVVTDPPYGLKFMGKTFDDLGDAAAQREWHRLWTVEALRVLKPGGYLLAMGGSRTYHHLASGIEEAGFEIRDRILYITGAGEIAETIGPELAWIYGQGFPKSLDVGKAIDKAAGAERKVIGQRTDGRYAYGFTDEAARALGSAHVAEQGMTGSTLGQLSAPATPEAQKWDGWGTALKPAHEPICVARKPLAGTVAANILAHGTGALNIDGCRIGTEGATTRSHQGERRHDPVHGFRGGHKVVGLQTGRWPANVILGEEAAAVLDEQTEGKVGHGHWAKTKVVGYGEFGGGSSTYEGVRPRDTSTGGASRFFYVAKPGRKEREAGLGALPAHRGEPERMNNTAGRQLEVGETERLPSARANIHPTVKPIALMRYLCRLVAAPGAVILDPFLGSGTTGCAVAAENNDPEHAPGWSFIGIEADADYMEIASARIAHWEAVPR
jgi:site-specific DNA-methyltransferase (adenine-specific)